MKNQNTQRDPLGIICLRMLLGSIFILAGTESFIQLLPFSITPEGTDTYINNLTGGGGLMYLIMAMQVIAGTMITFNAFAPLGILIVSPVLANILIYSLSVNTGNLPMAISLLLGVMVLVHFYRNIFKVFLKMQGHSGVSEKTCEILIIDEVEEKFPEKTQGLRELYQAIK